MSHQRLDIVLLVLLFGTSSLRVHSVGETDAGAKLVWLKVNILSPGVRSALAVLPMYDQRGLRLPIFPKLLGVGTDKVRIFHSWRSIDIPHRIIFISQYNGKIIIIP